VTAPTIKTVLGPYDEPVSVGDVKLHARISHDLDDGLVTSWISAGRELAEAYTKRVYMARTLEAIFDSFPASGPVDLPGVPLKSLVSVKYYDINNAEHTIDNSLFFVDIDSEPGRIAFTGLYRWPVMVLRAINGLKIRYTAGETDRKNVPAAVKDAILLYCTYRNENRTGETDSVPEQFFHILRPGKMNSL
jgi:uncharacterized phiE125 gp8 family phage protein